MNYYVDYKLILMRSNHQLVAVMINNIKSGDNLKINRELYYLPVLLRGHKISDSNYPLKELLPVLLREQHELLDYKLILMRSNHQLVAVMINNIKSGDNLKINRELYYLPVLLRGHKISDSNYPLKELLPVLLREQHELLDYKLILMRSNHQLVAVVINNIKSGDNLKINRELYYLPVLLRGHKISDSNYPLKELLPVLLREQHELLDYKLILMRSNHQPVAVMINKIGRYNFKINRELLSMNERS